MMYKRGDVVNLTAKVERATWGLYDEEVRVGSRAFDDDPEMAWIREE